MDTQQWLDDVWAKIVKKVDFTSKQIGDQFPHISTNGKFDSEDADWWTNGFYPGILWHVYRETKNESLRNIAESLEEKLDGPLHEYEKLHHDVGFMWSLSAVANYKITGNQKSRRRGLIAASHLTSRFNLKGNFIRTWNQWADGTDVSGWTIIDCMMNLPLMHWSSEEHKDPRFKFIAMAHADMAMREFIRPDGSVNHIVQFDAHTGEVVGHLGGQGYKLGSSWSRGQSWALYGFVLSYLYTRKQEYLDVSKKVANYFIANVADTDYVPLCDFRAPKEPVIIDTTSGLVAACGLIEIARVVEGSEGDMYMRAAIRILKSIEEKYGNWTEEEEAMITMGTVAYDRTHHVPIIYADYYFVEAITKLRGAKELFW